MQRRTLAEEGEYFANHLVKYPYGTSMLLTHELKAAYKHIKDTNMKVSPIVMKELTTALYWRA